ncbi:uncharacterized protein LOC143922378 [Arctopsyche grandis]|uniref:uncharacterized protein LOC143922378 n=1 Tax=Arctopsyche grandis TaxID=121162 RepID=UPI00406DA43A
MQIAMFAAIFRQKWNWLWKIAIVAAFQSVGRVCRGLIAFIVADNKRSLERTRSFPENEAVLPADPELPIQFAEVVSKYHQIVADNKRRLEKMQSFPEMKLYC